ncbi:MAG: Gfo/Idh/MocA family oxidoreductase [Abditibacteriales bacterium]|nr:Gfo/Idh/MocA family oxidoreductase [Abditibacteriales bacterium]MDW8366035.1 Gfo/Idh/MocA family oxidoreductase [Abditibacteriales bacterium]
MSQLNMALIGAGRRGAGAHAPVIAKLKDVFNFVAVCDMDEATAKSVAERYGARAYMSVRDLLKSEEIDVADVVVPGDAHHAISWFLSENGVHHLVETPIAATLPLADLMIETAQKNRVKLEVAENYYRAPMEQFKSQVLAAGVIGKVSRLYRIFHEGGYHGMSLLRIRAGGHPTSVLGIAHTSEVTPLTDRMKRHHTQEHWTLGVVDFDNGVLATMIYSNVIHARSLGRGVGGVSQIDGTAGTVVGDDFYLVPPGELQTGAVAQAYTPQRVRFEQDGVQVLDRIEMQTPDGQFVWNNPFKRYALTEGQIAIADELMSLARAVCEDREPDYGAAAGRLDQEMNLGMHESATVNRQVVTFPLQSPTTYERQIHESFQQKYGCDARDVERLVDVFFPRL